MIEPKTVIESKTVIAPKLVKETLQERMEAARKEVKANKEIQDAEWLEITAVAHRMAFDEVTEKIMQQLPQKMINSINANCTYVVGNKPFTKSIPIDFTVGDEFTVKGKRMKRSFYLNNKEFRNKVSDHVSVHFADATVQFRYTEKAGIFLLCIKGTPKAVINNVTVRHVAARKA